MKKTIPKIVSRKQILVGASVVVSVLLAVLAVPNLVIPQFASWQKVKNELREESQKLASIDKNVQMLSKLDKEQVNDYQKLLTKLVPAENDTLRSISIIDQLVRSGGLSLKKVMVKAATPITRTSTQTSTQTKLPTTSKGGGAPTTTSAKQSTQPAASAANSYSIIFTVEGGFPATLDFIADLARVKQTIEVTKISISQASSVPVSTADIELRFPLSKKQEVAADTNVSLSRSDEDILNGLLLSLTIDASPSNQPLGKIDPFR